MKRRENIMGMEGVYGEVLEGVNGDGGGNAEEGRLGRVNILSFPAFLREI